jgi:hypothetical protein
LDGVLVICDRAPASVATGKFDRELVDALPKSVKFICHMGKSAVPPASQNVARREVREPLTT